MSANLSPIEVVAWLRKQAKTYSDAADSIESTITPSSSMHGPDTTVRELNGRKAIYPALTLDALKKRLSQKSARAGDLAVIFGASENDILDVLKNESNGFTSKERGWWKYEPKE